ncbi:MAG: hypothetical protein KGI54_13215 [Pseudomonadota bacterium]|nr:hypothetical protein [Pseudomonadota bacterium]
MDSILMVIVREPLIPTTHRMDIGDPKTYCGKVVHTGWSIYQKPGDYVGCAECRKGKRG